VAAPGRASTWHEVLQEVQAVLVLVGCMQSDTQGVGAGNLPCHTLIDHVLHVLLLADGSLEEDLRGDKPERIEPEENNT
jgi:hypothetical protein